MAKASPVTAAQERAALARPASDPPTRLDGLCYVCEGERGRVAVKHDDPFCTSRCARRHHGTELATDLAASPPARSSAVSRSERDKGLKGEAEVAAIYRRLGAEVRGLEAIGDHLIITPGAFGPELHSEVKRQEVARVWLWWEQATSEAPLGTMPVVHFRRNRSPWLALVDAEQLAALLCELATLRAVRPGL